MSVEVSEIRAVVFDLYNTLCANPRGSWIKTFQKICQIEHLELDPADLYTHWKDLELNTRRERVNIDDISLTRRFVPYRDVWESCFREIFGYFRFQADPADAARLCIEDMGQRPLFPGSRTVLEILRRKYKIGLLSNADDSFLLPFLEKAELGFDAALSSENVGAYKPHPKGFMTISAQLNVEPHQVLFVGDTLLDDILGAQRVGMMTAYVVADNSNHTEESTVPDLRITTVRELLDLL